MPFKKGLVLSTFLFVSYAAGALETTENLADKVLGAPEAIVHKKILEKAPLK